MMSKISVVEAKLPAGFRFHPRDEELVCDYLMKKVTHRTSFDLFIDVDLNICEPWDIPETACVGGKDWYFYSRRDRKYASGVRTNRATASGYWKATGKDRAVLRKGTLVGMRKTLVFYKGRAPKGTKTDWIMHEFRLEPPPTPKNEEDWVLCRVFYKKRVSVGNMESNWYDDTGCSSSLPPLTDSYITFDQTQPNLHHDYHDHDHEQVPCFSIFSQNPNFTNQLLPVTPDHHHRQHHDHHLSSSDNNFIKAMLNQLTNDIKASPSMAEAASSDCSYLSEVAMPTTALWNQFP